MEVSKVMGVPPNHPNHELVGGLEHLFFPICWEYLGIIIIPTDEVIFF